jgi:hypothetical protein
VSAIGHAKPETTELRILADNAEAHFGDQRLAFTNPAPRKSDMSPCWTRNSTIEANQEILRDTYGTS